MHLIASDHVIDHGWVSSKAPSRSQNGEDVQELQLVLLGYYVLKEVPDTEDDKYGVHEARDAHGDPREHELALMAGHVEIK